MSAPSPHTAAVLLLLEQHGELSTIDLQCLAGMEDRPLRHVLDRLNDANKAHRKQRAVLKNGRWQPAIWSAGPDPSAATDDRSGWVPARPVVQQWTPKVHRDPYALPMEFFARGST